MNKKDKYVPNQSDIDLWYHSAICPHRDGKHVVYVEGTNDSESVDVHMVEYLEEALEFTSRHDCIPLDNLRLCPPSTGYSNAPKIEGVGGIFKGGKVVSYYRTFEKQYKRLPASNGNCRVLLYGSDKRMTTALPSRSIFSYTSSAFLYAMIFVYSPRWSQPDYAAAEVFTKERLASAISPNIMFVGAYGTKKMLKSCLVVYQHEVIGRVDPDNHMKIDLFSDSPLGVEELIHFNYKLGVES